MKPITMVVSSGADPPPGEPPGDPGEYQQHQQTIPGASAGLIPEEYDYLYQQKQVYDDDMMYKTTTKKTDAITENKTQSTAHDNDNNNHKARPYQQFRKIPMITSSAHTAPHFTAHDDDDNDNNKTRRFKPIRTTTKIPTRAHNPPLVMTTNATRQYKPNQTPTARTNDDKI